MERWELSWPGRPAGEGSLGRRIASLRAERGWTQQGLADRLGISRVAVSHLETDLNLPGERTVALLAGLFRVEPHDLVAGSSYPQAKADRLPLVVARWTEAEHRLALLERDLWWLDGADGAAAPASAAMVERVLAGWDATLGKLADQLHEPSERAAVAAARSGLAERRGRDGRGVDEAEGPEKG